MDHEKDEITLSVSDSALKVGSSEAIKKGCKCDPALNLYGYGVHGIGVDNKPCRLFFASRECSLHGSVST